MATTAVVSSWWSNYLHSWNTLERVEILGRYPVYIQPPAYEAARAFNQALIATGYENPTDYIGSWADRRIAGSNTWSLHAYGIAIDLDYGYLHPDRTPDKNPHVHHPIGRNSPGWGRDWQINQEQVDAVEAIRNTEGERVWRWLGWSIGDTMHFQIDVPPHRTTIAWSTVATLEEDMFTQYGAESAIVYYWQATLANLGQNITLDGSYGEQTKAAVAALTASDGSAIRGGEAAELHRLLGLGGPSAVEGTDPTARRDAAAAQARADTAHQRLDAAKKAL